LAGSGCEPGPVSFWTPKRPESNTSGNQILTNTVRAAERLIADAGKQLDQMLHERIPEFSRSRILCAGIGVY